MLDSLLKPVIEPHIKKLAAKTAALGIKPSHLTFIGFSIGVIGCLGAGFQNYWFALVLILLSRLAVSLHETMVQSAETQSPFSSYISTLADIFVVSAFAFFFSLGQPNQIMASALLLFSYTILNASYMASKNGNEKPASTLGNLVSNTETNFFMALCCLIPDLFAGFAVIFAILCWMSTVGHILDVRKNLKD